MNRVQEMAHAFWQARTDRERRILVAAILILVPLLFWLLLIEPAWQGRAAWQKKLPALRDEHAQLQALLDELKTEPETQAASAGTTGPAMPLSSQLLDNSLSARGMKPSSLSVEGQQAQLTFKDIPFSVLLGWLQEMRSRARLQVTEAAITARQQTDHVDATLRLHQARE